MSPFRSQQRGIPTTLLFCASLMITSFPEEAYAQNNSVPNSQSKAEGTTIPAPKLPARGTMEVTGDASKLSVYAVGVDAAQLLTTIASKANLKLVVDDVISRRITISVKNKSAKEIIATIGGAYGLAIADLEGVTVVSEGIPRTPSSYLLSDIDQISTKYVDAANARNLLPVFLQDYVKVNSEQNAVVLSAPGEVLKKFRSDIAGFDIPAAQIMVDLLLVELTDTGLDALNLNLNYANAGNSVAISPTQGTVSFNALTTLPSQFFVSLQALTEKGRAQVRANPRIATVSGRRASIFVGRQRYIVTPIDTGGGQRNYIDAGVRLAITPYTGGEKSIMVDVDTEVSTLSALDPITRLPEKSTRTATTKVRVGDGQTIVIGGLKQQETRDVRTKVPILGDLPILGPALFQSRNQRTTNSELVLFITPRLLSPTGHLPENEEELLKSRYLAPDLSAPLPSPSFEIPNGAITPQFDSNVPVDETGTTIKVMPVPAKKTDE
jgi:type II secretory pathway component GspD/PulD (secretin)